MPGTGIDPGRKPTPREREVLQQAALGKSNRQIGEALEIAEQTVKNHLSSAMRKLSLHDRTHAVVVGLGQGWIRLPILKGFAISEADLVQGHRVDPSEPSKDQRERTSLGRRRC